MLIRQNVLERIRAGEVTLVFRRWTRPAVTAGGTLKTAVGVLAIDSVERIPLRRITAKDARLAGYNTLAELTSFLTGRDGDVYRLALRFAGADPRVSLRESLPSPEEIARICSALRRMDERSRRGPWTFTVLSLIGSRPGVRAPDLAQSLGRETLQFKADVRRLKELGLTKSLAVGYRLSPRGQAVVGQQPIP
ncbi:hypothetical protein [Kibdelosporangium phytohabitans]|uniref:ASCH domain-containing protein n=1 Tax=Kibdelosporangium phytohabitans TaxID=860235 RepID=A0A0N9I881_9PSEU|nr:hypothetical protein [Kibdelosporangium phytohabitans]ALG12414.1 hypothetical protein AOZ06_41110 [Kibdelosporangium phytohabitans]MBE1463999.1 hypothetical protein [Kibdelosporangium phytohabitans]